MPKLEDVKLDGTVELSSLVSAEAYGKLTGAVAPTAPTRTPAQATVVVDDGITYTQEQIESRRAIAQIRKDEIANESAEQDKTLRRYTAAFLAVVLIGIVSFQSCLLWQVGGGSLEYTKYPWLVDIVVAQNFAQVVGLAYIVVNNLFPTSEKIAASVNKRVEKVIEAKQKSESRSRTAPRRKARG